MNKPLHSNKEYIDAISVILNDITSYILFNDENLAICRKDWVVKNDPFFKDNIADKVPTKPVIKRRQSIKKCKVCDKELKLIGSTHTCMDCPDDDDGNTYKEYYECENGHKLIEIFCPNGSQPFVRGMITFDDMKSMQNERKK